MARRKMGAIGTTELLLIGGGVLAVYLLTRPKTPTVPTIVTVPSPGGMSTAALQAQTQQTTAEVNAGASVLNNLFSTLFD